MADGLLTRKLSELFNDTGQARGWCLRHDREVLLTWPLGIMSAFAHCPLCGLVDEQFGAYHVFNPSEPLLKKLRGDN